MSLTDRIASLVANNPGQMRSEEYAAVAECFLTVQPRHALVFGCGRDSQLWQSLMPPGAFIAFVEDNLHWARGVTAPVILAHYSGTVAEWRSKNPLTAMDCTPLLVHVPWDLILIDGPFGDRPTAPGRLGPIRFAANQRKAAVIVHDVHRDLERAACDLYLHRPFREVHHLRIFDRPQE